MKGEGVKVKVKVKGLCVEGVRVHKPIEESSCIENEVVDHRDGGGYGDVVNF